MARVFYNKNLFKLSIQWTLARPFDHVSLEILSRLIRVTFRHTDCNVRRNHKYDSKLTFICMNMESNNEIASFITSVRQSVTQMRCLKISSEQCSNARASVRPMLDLNTPHIAKYVQRKIVIFPHVNHTICEILLILPVFFLLSLLWWWFSWIWFSTISTAARWFTLTIFITLAIFEALAI